MKLFHVLIFDLINFVKMGLCPRVDEFRTWVGEIMNLYGTNQNHWWKWIFGSFMIALEVMPFMLLNRLLPSADYTAKKIAPQKYFQKFFAATRNWTWDLLLTRAGALPLSYGWLLRILHLEVLFLSWLGKVWCAIAKYRIAAVVLGQKFKLWRKLFWWNHWWQWIFGSFMIALEVMPFM